MKFNITKNIVDFSETDIFDGTRKSLKNFCDMADTDMEDLKSFVIPDTVTKLDDFAFYDCKSLERIDIPNGIQEMGVGAFCGCDKLVDVSIPDSLSSISPSAFCGCSGLESVTIPDGIIDISDQAFYNCTNLKNIFIPNSVSNIGIEAFKYCDDICINCYKDSYAEKYAKENYIPVKLIEDAELMQESKSRKFRKKNKNPFAVQINPDPKKSAEFFNMAMTTGSMPTGPMAEEFKDELKESLHSLSSNCFITDSPYDIKNLIMNKPKLYRILYDANIDMYMIGDGNEVIHWNMIKAAHKQGYYANQEEFIDELGGTLDNYVETGVDGLYDDDYEIDPYLLYMVFSPNKNEFSLGEDDYDDVLKFNFGFLFLRDASQELIDNCDLIKILQKQNLTNESTEFNEDIWDKNGTKYQPKQDSKYKRLIQKPINTLTQEEIKYIFTIHWCGYLSQVRRFDYVEDALKEVSKRFNDSYFKECYDFFQTLSFPLKIYRAIRDSELSDNEFNINGKNSSHSWTTNINIYKDNTSKFRNCTKIVSCEIDSNVIDVANTINNFIFYTSSHYARGYGEYEITLKQHFSQNDLRNLHLIDKNEVVESMCDDNLNEKFVNVLTPGEFYYFIKNDSVHYGKFKRKTPSWYFFEDENGNEIMTSIFNSVADNKEELEQLIGLVNKMEKDTKIPSQVPNRFTRVPNQHNKPMGESIVDDPKYNFDDYDREDNYIVEENQGDLKMEFEKISLYLFPELTDEDLQMVKAYGLNFMGKNYGPDGEEENWVVTGQESQLKRYAQNWLGYELHPDYFYEDEADLAGDVEEVVTESKSIKESFRDEANDDDTDDIQTYFYDDEAWEDSSVSARKDFDAEGQEFTWVIRHGDVEHLDFDNWAVWEAYCHDDAETYYFVVDEDTGFIDWGPVETLEEAQEFLASKVSDWENLDESFEDKYVIYKQNGVFKGTPKSNYDAKIRNARLISDFKTFNSAEEIIDYMTTYTGVKDRENFEVIDEGYELLNGNKVEVYSDYNIAKARANELGLKEAEYGDAYGSDYSYCYWNESGDRNDNEQIIAYYKFENGKSRPLTSEEADFIKNKYEIDSFDNFSMKNESESINESSEETPYTKEEVEKDLKSITHNFTDKEGELKCGFEEEKNFGVEILKQHYKVVEVSGDDRRDGTWYHISYAEPVINEDFNKYRDEEGHLLADKWYASVYPDDKVGIEQLNGLTMDDILKDRKLVDHCDTQVKERVYAQLDKYIPLSKESSMYKEKNESSSIDEAWEPEFKEEDWEQEDIDLWKSIDWKARNYMDYPVPEDSFEYDAIAYGFPGGKQVKKVKFIKYLRSNPIYPPYYAPEKKAFEHTVGSMYDGHKKGKYGIHNRYETQEVYDMLSEDAVKTKDGKWVNKGDSGETHGEFKTKKAADAQRKAIFANGFKG